jgi:hypothetical protein
VYVSHIPQRALGHKTPREALLEWYERSPGLFRADPHDHPGLDTYPTAGRSRPMSSAGSL